MPDYDLYRLSPRSFEQLIQTIAIKLLGSGTIIFGDGPDKGREATFEGKSNFPSSTEPWNGYVVVQAKFRQRESTRVSDANWARRQLQTELNQFAEPSTSRRRPEYYIFATNVTLSPGAGGGKEKVLGVLDHYTSVLGLRGYAVWDYDLIRAVLDGDTSIRYSFGAWITPGDVLQAIVDDLSPRVPDFYATIANYLQKELLSDQYVNLEQAGHTVENRIPLARVFVDLPAGVPGDRNAGVRSNRRGIVAELLQVAALKPGDGESRHGVWLKRDLQLGSRVVVVGGPGQGKTTVAQFLSQLYRAAILETVPSDHLANEVRLAIEDIKHQCASEGIRLPDALRFPVRIVLNEFATALANDKSGTTSLIGYIAYRIRQRTGRDVDVAHIRQWLQRMPWLLVLDGLDEVPASSNRDDVLKAVAEFAVDVQEAGGDVFVVATTRPQGYNHDFSPEFYSHVLLRPLMPKEAMHYAERLTQARYHDDVDRSSKVIARLARAAENEATARLMHSPLQVTIMCALVDKFGQPPQERWNLFREYYEVIYAREVERDIPAASILRAHKPNVDTIHHRVGLLLQLESERKGSTDARLSNEQFRGIVVSHLEEEGYLGFDRDVLSSQISSAAAERLVFLVGVQADAVGFEIRSLQEFMAAEAIVDGSDDTVRNRLRELAPVTSWRNAILFAVGKCFVARQYLRETIYSVCAELNDDPNDPIAALALLGSWLALDILEDGPPRRQPKYSLLFVRLALRLLDAPRTRHGSVFGRLAAIYELSFEEIYKADLVARLQRKDFGESLSAWNIVLLLMAVGVEWTKGIAEEYWPKDNREVQALFALDDINLNYPWIKDKLDLLMHSLNFSEIRGFYIPGEVIGEPAWLNAATQLVFRTAERPESLVWVPFGVPGGLHLGIVPLGGNEAGWNDLRALRDFPSPSRSWLPVFRGLEFIEKPDRFTLASVLRESAEHFSKFFCRWGARNFPWPLAACLELAKSPEDLELLAVQSETGELGDISDWLPAQFRWLGDGVTSDDLLALNTLDCRPFSANNLPFPLWVAKPDYSLVTDVLLAEMLIVWENLSSQVDQQYLRRWLFSGLEELVRFGRTLDTLRENRTVFAQLVRKMIRAEPFLPGEVLLGMGYVLDFGEDWVSAMDERGKLSTSIYSSETKLAFRIAEAFIRNPQCNGLLGLLGQLGDLQAIRQIPDSLLTGSAADDAIERTNVLVVGAMKLNWKKQQLSRMVRDLHRTASTRPNILATLARGLPAEHGNPQAELLLMEIARYTQGDKPLASLLQHIAKGWLDRRTSTLMNPSVWDKLQLPDRLRGIALADEDQKN
jgi:hypothetical protein